MGGVWEVGGLVDGMGALTPVSVSHPPHWDVRASPGVLGYYTAPEACSSLPWELREGRIGPTGGWGWGVWEVGGLVDQKVTDIDPLTGIRPVSVVGGATPGPWSTAVVSTSRGYGSQAPRLP